MCVQAGILILLVFLLFAVITHLNSLHNLRWYYSQFHFNPEKNVPWVFYILVKVKESNVTLSIMDYNAYLLLSKFILVLMFEYLQKVYYADEGF